jgi:preprotein translocase subunit SecG
MNIVIWLLTFVLVLTCLFLCLLVLVQLPKKEAGLGQAFGSGATDALFGPGSGNMLTNMTKWVAGIFFALTLLVWVLYGMSARPSKGVDPRSRLTAAERAALAPMPQNTAAATATPTNTPGTNQLSTNVVSLLSGGTNTAKVLTSSAPAAITNAAPPK